MSQRYNGRKGGKCTFAVCPSPVPAGLTLALKGAFGVDALRVFSTVVGTELALIDV